MTKINYDKKSRIMSIRLKKSKSIESDVQNNIVIDYDKQGSIVNIDIMGISMNEFGRIPTSVRETVDITKERMGVSNQDRKFSRNEQ